MVAGSGKEALVGRDAKPVDLGVWVLDGARTDARKGFPESVLELANMYTLRGCSSKAAWIECEPDGVVVSR